MTDEERRERRNQNIRDALARRKERIASGEIQRGQKGTGEDCGHREGAKHDCAYVDGRNALIPAAERLAKVDAGAFFVEMDRLAISAGIMKPPGPWLAEQKRRDAERRARQSATVGWAGRGQALPAGAVVGKNWGA